MCRQRRLGAEIIKKPTDANLRCLNSVSQAKAVCTLKTYLENSLGIGYCEISSILSKRAQRFSPPMHAAKPALAIEHATVKPHEHPNCHISERSMYLQLLLGNRPQRQR